MKIATWNLERLSANGSKTSEIISYIEKVDADIWILTETNDFIDLGFNHIAFHTTDFKGPFYKTGDKQVSIYSRVPIKEHILTFRSTTSLCLDIKTPLGDLIVYGTIIGNFGNRGDQFKDDLGEQLLDFEKLYKIGNLCIAGDFNISFSDDYYFTKDGRLKLKDAFQGMEMKIMTEAIAKNIDHIVLSKSFIGKQKIIIDYWNEERRLSDHMGVSVEIFE